MTLPAPHTPSVDRIKASFAICTAARIYRDVQGRPLNAATYQRMRIASDAIDKTMPMSGVMERHRSKPVDQCDADFLMENIDSIMMLPVANWPERKVSPREWGEYTRVMRGMEAFLTKAHTGTPFTKEERVDVQGAIRFIEPEVLKLKDTAVQSAILQASP